MRRNDPCNCGSGKKYKKCCALQNELSVEALVDEELTRFIGSFLENPFETNDDYTDLKQYERIWTQKLRGLVDEQLFDQIFSKYFIFVARRDLWKRTVLKALNSPLRQGTKEVLAMWQNAFVIFGEVIEVEDDYYRVAQSLGHESYTVGKEKVNVEKGGLIFGVGFPDARVYQDGVVFITAQMIGKEATEEIVELVTAMAQKSGEKRSNVFFEKHMVDVYKVLFEWLPNEGEELSEKEVAVITVADHILREAGFHEEDIEQTQVMILFYLQEEPSYRKPEMIAAAVVYMMQDYHMYEHEMMDYTQKEVAQMFNVSVGSMMNHVVQIEALMIDLFNDGEGNRNS